MKARQFIMNKDLTSAINSLEIWAGYQAIETDRLKSVTEIIKNLKALAYDTATEILIDDLDGDMYGELDEPDEDNPIPHKMNLRHQIINRLIVGIGQDDVVEALPDYRSLMEGRCNSILDRVNVRQAGRVTWYPRAQGAHTIWVSRILFKLNPKI